MRALILFLTSCSNEGDLRTLLEIGSNDLPLGKVGQMYRAELSAVGGAPPYLFGTAGDVPPAPGLEITGEGLVIGVPAERGRFPVEVVLTDAAGGRSEKILALTISGDDPTFDSPCEAPILISGSIVGRLGSTRAPAGICGAAERAEAHFAFVLATAARVRVDVEPADVTVGLLTSCLPATETVCDPISAELQAGTHRLGVQGPAGAPFSLTLEIDPSDGTCEHPIPVDLSSGSALLSGSFGGAQVSMSSCAGPQPTVVHEIALDEPSDLLFSLAGAPEADVAVGAPACAGEPLVCETAASRLYVEGLQPGPYTIAIGKRYEVDSFAYLVERFPTTPRPANDRCESATDLGRLNSTLAAAGGWLGALSDGRFDCGDDVARYYAFELAADAHVEVTDRGGSAEIALFEACGADQISCGHGRACRRDLRLGRYIIRVARGSNGTDASFDLELRRRDPPPPANDTCGGALPITSRVVATFDGARPNITTSCGSGLDLFYTLTPVERVDVTIEHGASYVSSALLGGDCSMPTEEACSLLNQLTLYGIDPGQRVLVLSYYRDITASCVDPQELELDLTITLSPSPPEPANDTCAAPEVVTFPLGVGSIEGILGTTRGAFDDVAMRECPSRSPESTGVDVFYALEVPAAARVRITPTSGPDLDLSLHSINCGAEGALACEQFAGALETAFAVPPGTYYLRVEQVLDSSSTPADFSLAVELLPP